MARRPGQGGRPRSRRHLLRRALALGGGAVDAILLLPRVLWRVLPSSFRSKNSRRARATAARARRAVDGALFHGGRALASLHRVLASLHRALASLHRALASLHRALAPSRHLRALRRLLLPPPPPPQQQEPPQEQQQEEQQEDPPQEEEPPQEPAPQAGAWIYGRLARRRTTATTATYTVDGVEVPEGVIKDYVRYCSKASTCHRSLTVCHLCEFEGQRSQNCMVPTSYMFLHCSYLHRDKNKEPSVRCGEAGCNVRTRPGHDQTLHQFFCHQLPPGWWMD